MKRTILSLMLFLFVCSYASTESYGQEIDLVEFAETVRVFKINFYKEVNKFRVAHFRRPLKVSVVLEQESEEWVSKGMGERMHHDYRANGYEILTNAANPLQSWKDSKPHRKVLLARGVTIIGFAFDYKSSVSCARLR